MRLLSGVNLYGARNPLSSTTRANIADVGSNDDRRPPAETQARPFPDSLCWRCENHREIRAARSSFVMCSALPVKYPRQPVVACATFAPALETGGAE
jgi:hypothetical protein